MFNPVIIILALAICFIFIFWLANALVGNGRTCPFRGFFITTTLSFVVSFMIVTVSYYLNTTRTYTHLSSSGYDPQTYTSISIYSKVFLISFLTSMLSLSRGLKFSVGRLIADNVVGSWNKHLHPGWEDRWKYWNSLGELLWMVMPFSLASSYIFNNLWLIVIGLSILAIKYLHDRYLKVDMEGSINPNMGTSSIMKVAIAMSIATTKIVDKFHIKKDRANIDKDAL
jgi:hypothetical protein